MLRIVESELVQARVHRACKQFPSFQVVFDGVIWRLARDPGVLARSGSRIGDHDPAMYILVTNAWKAAGIPKVRLMAERHSDHIHIMSMALYE